MCIRDRYQRRVRGAPWCSMLEEVGYSAGGHPCEELYWYGGGAAGVKGALPGVLLGLSTGIIFTVNTFVHGASEGCSSWPSWGPLMANSALVGMFGVGCFLAGGLLRSSRSPFAHLAAAHSASVLSLLLCSVGVAVCSSELYVIAACGVGFGVGIIYMAGMSVTLSWFQNRKVVATAIYSTVSGISSLALQRVNTSLSDSYGLEVTFFVLASTVALFGGVTCTVCEFGPYHIAQGSVSCRGEPGERASSRPTRCTHVGAALPSAARTACGRGLAVLRIRRGGWWCGCGVGVPRGEHHPRAAISDDVGVRCDIFEFRHLRDRPVWDRELQRHHRVHALGIRSVCHVLNILLRLPSDARFSCCHKYRCPIGLRAELLAATVHSPRPS
eukprot:TRINITY_DN28216_c0_g1_i2.p1 TRINITY_DN28216_c0_g1~~TRINITY_DN28216_c0_g1_i2.p1  ORF type:complete len:385 (+),score=21.05 TRINITY_DN28216_c0_g1_i2:140-1294(+)